MTERCPDCGLPTRSYGECADDDGYCYAHVDADVEVIACRDRTIARLKAQAQRDQETIRELRRETEAWRALAQFVADKGGCIDALRGVDGCDLFVAFDAETSTGFEGTSCEQLHFGACAIDVATKLGLLNPQQTESAELARAAGKGPDGGASIP